MDFSNTSYRMIYFVESLLSLLNMVFLLYGTNRYHLVSDLRQL